MTALTARLLEESFSRDKLRLFPTQAQLFDFIDHHNNNNNIDEDSWRPFSIELDSASSVYEQRERAGATLDAILAGEGPSLFRRVPKRRRCSEEQQQQQLEQGQPHQRRVSSQTRFFIALRDSFIFEFHCSIPIGQQHLYEIIRESQPCHMYLDVEQEVDFIPSAEVDLASSTLPIARREPRWCPPNCPVRPDHKRTTEILLTNLDLFLSSKDLGLFLKNACIVVLRSVPIAAGISSTKFSQHFIIRFQHAVFKDNQSVGALIRDFVDWLYVKATHDEEVHSALFFHAEPLAAHKNPSEDSIAVFEGEISSLPQSNEPPQRRQMPLRCIIDTSVYSRNRMFRCYGSTKLGKGAALFLDPFHEVECQRTHAASHDMFASTLISSTSALARAEISRVVQYGESSSVSQNTEKSRASVMRHAAGRMQRLPSPFPEVDAFVNTVMLQNPPFAKRTNGSNPVVTHFEIINDEHLTIVYHVQGTKYCGNIQREHKSNGIYLVAVLPTRKIFQKCFDPDCKGYRSPPHEIPETVTATSNDTDRSESNDAPLLLQLDRDEELRQYAKLRTRIVLRPVGE